MVREALATPWHVGDPAALSQLRAQLLERHPTLHLSIEEDQVWVRGTVPITHDNALVTRYQLEIQLPTDYPFSLPTIWETGGRIPRTMVRHVEPERGTLCIGVLPDLWMTCGGRFDLCSYLDGPVKAYLVGNSLVERGEPWPHGEWSHGAVGVLQYYGEIIDNQDHLAVCRLLSYLGKEKIKGHWPCPCGRGEILRRCHGQSIWQLHRSLPPVVVNEAIRRAVQVLDAMVAEGPERPSGM